MGYVMEHGGETDVEVDCGDTPLSVGSSPDGSIELRALSGAVLSIPAPSCSPGQ
jgi:hypothetical protein